MAALHADEATHEPKGFIRRYIFSTDHKVIGIQYFLTGMAVAVIAGLLAMLIRLQLAWPDAKWPLLEKLFPEGMAGGVMNPEFYLALVTMHGTLMVFFVVSFALVSGFGNFLIPLQIGARDMAFPFLNMLSYWTVVPATFIMFASFFVEGGAAAAGCSCRFWARRSWPLPCVLCFSAARTWLRLTSIFRCSANSPKRARHSSNSPR